MLVADQLHYSVEGKKILQDISFHIPTTTLYVIVGPNGSGKSSLLRCLSGWTLPTSGNITFNQENIHRLPTKTRASKIAFLPQRPRFSESIPIVDIIAAARYRFYESHHQSRHNASALLKKNNLEHLAKRDWHTLSGGEAQRIALLCMLAQDAEVWLLDEPANHLDPAIQKETYRTLIEEWMSGRTLIVVTHNINLILSSVPRDRYSDVCVLGLEKGKTSFELRLSDSLLPQKVGMLYQLPVQKISVFERDHLVFGTPE